MNLIENYYSLRLIEHSCFQKLRQCLSGLQGIEEAKNVSLSLNEIIGSEY